MKHSAFLLNKVKRSSTPAAHAAAAAAPKRDVVAEVAAATKPPQPQILDDDVRVVKNEQGIETLVFDPFNPVNQLISVDQIQTILRTYGVDAPIHNFELYKRAFVHKSYLRRPDAENAQNNITVAPKPDHCLGLFTKSNERLEFVGDGVLECITKYVLYRRFPKENEGFMTEKKIALVKNESIGKMALEMGLHKWLILSKHAESKQTRTNLKKLGCLFESFLGAMFLDFNKVAVKDEHGWFENTFLTGPGFQMVQIFVEQVFEKHVDWINLIKNDDNYKNLLQVRIQKEFKVTPDYLECTEYDVDRGYHMGVYLCLGQPIHAVKKQDAIRATTFAGGFADIHQYMSVHRRILVLLGEGSHKIKKKAEQIACEEALRVLQNF
jgi:dsRNA-specific ribonuclease